MNGAEDKVPRLGGVDGRHKRLFIPQFTNQNDVRIFSQCVFHPNTEINDVNPDLPLVDQTLLVFKNKLNRVFEGQYMFDVVTVDVI